MRKSSPRRPGTYMNLAALKFARDIRGLDGPAKAVLYCLATHVDEAGLCWPSLAVISEESGVSKSTVCVRLADLERRGILRRVTGNRDASTRYHVLYQEADLSPARTEGKSASVRETDKSRNHLSVARTDICPGDGHEVSSKESSTLPLSVFSSEEGERGGEADTAVGAVVRTWESLGLPKVRSLTAGRRKRILARLRDPEFRDHHAAGMARIAASDFHTGRLPGKTWRADLDWFLKPESLEKALDLPPAPHPYPAAAAPPFPAPAGGPPGSGSGSAAGSAWWLPFPGWEDRFPDACPGAAMPHTWKNLTNEQRKAVHGAALRKSA